VEYKQGQVKGLTVWLHNIVLIKQNLLIPYDSFSQMSTIYLTCIKNLCNAGCVNFSTALKYNHMKSFVVAIVKIKRAFKIPTRTKHLLYGSQ
jgi:hypothetical protein